VNSTEVILGVEEAHLLVSRQKMQRYDMEPRLVRLLRMGRKHGMSCLVIDQIPSDLAWAVQGNLATRIVMRLINDPCVRTIARTMGLDEEQTVMLAELPRRQAIVQTARSPQPFLVRIVEMAEPECAPEEELLERERVSLELLGHCEKEADAVGVLFGEGRKKDTAVPAIRGDMHGVLARMCEFPWELIDERCEALGLERAREYRARENLLKIGMIALGDRVGSKWQLYVPTDKGREWARAMGIKVPSFKSGVGHERMVRTLRQRLEGAFPGIEFFPPGKSLGISGVQPDLLAGMGRPEGDSGFRMAIQIGSQNKADYEARKAVELSRIPQVDLVIIVARNKSHRRDIERKLRELLDEGGSAGEAAGEGVQKGSDSEKSETHLQKPRERIVTLDFETCISPDCNWRCIME
jgi:hypothetical protein